MSTKMSSVSVKNLETVFNKLHSLFHETNSSAGHTPSSWKDFDSTALQTFVRAAKPQSVASVQHFFCEADPGVILSCWSAKLGEIIDALKSVCKADDLVWIDTFCDQNTALTTEEMIELTGRRYRSAKRHALLVTKSQDVELLLCRGWIAFEIAVRMRSGNGMVELIDPHGKAVELYEAGWNKDVFESLVTSEAQEKIAIQAAIRKVFANSRSDGGSDRSGDFNNGVHDLLRLACARNKVEDIAKTENKQLVLEFGWDAADEMYAKAMYQDFVVVQEHVLVAVREKNGDEHADVAKSLHLLGNGLAALGSHASALERYSEALLIRRCLFGDGHADVAATLNKMAIVNTKQGRLEEALLKYGEALRSQKGAHGDDHVNVAATLHEMGVVYWKQRRLEEALTKFEEALKIRTTALGGAHVDVGATKHCMAIVYHIQGRHKEALEKYDEALQIRMSALGDAHVDVAQTLYNIGIVYGNQRMHAEALVKHEEALKIRKRALGEEHVDVAQSLNRIAIDYAEQGRHEEALVKHEEALKMRMRLLGEDHLDVAQTLNDIAIVYSQQARHAEAVVKYEEALKGKKKALGDNHVSVASTLFNLGLVCRSMCSLERAEALFAEAHQIRLAALGPEHRETRAAAREVESCKRAIFRRTYPERAWRLPC